MTTPIWKQHAEALAEGKPIKPAYYLHAKEYLQEARDLIFELGLPYNAQDVIALATLLATVAGEQQ
jgi:hypothetical protein